MKRLALLITILSTSVFCFAAGEQSVSINKLVDQFYAAKAAKSSVLNHVTKPQGEQFNNCPPNPVGPSCADTVCKKLGYYGCDQIDEIEIVGRDCRGNYDGRCVTAVCEKLGYYGCDQISETSRVSRACVGNYSTDCFHSVCEKLGFYGCDQIDEVERVLRSCSGY